MQQAVHSQALPYQGFGLDLTYNKGMSLELLITLHDIKLRELKSGKRKYSINHWNRFTKSKSYTDDNGAEHILYKSRKGGMEFIIPSDSNECQICIKAEDGTGDLRARIERLQDVYEMVAGVLDKCGYDTKGPDSFMKKLSPQDIGKMPVHHKRGPSRQKLDSERPEEVGSNEADDLRIGSFNYQCNVCEGEHSIISEGTPDGTPSLFSSIIIRETLSGEKENEFGIKTETFEELKNEAAEFLNRGLQLNKYGASELAIIDTRRGIRILNYIRSSLNEIDYRLGNQHEITDFMAEAWCNVYCWSSQFAENSGDLGLALRLIERGRAIILDIYSKDARLDIKYVDSSEDEDKNRYADIREDPVKVKGLRDELIRNLLEQEKDVRIGIDKQNSHGISKMSTFTPLEYTLDEQRDYYLNLEQYELVKPLNNRIKERDSVNPLQLSLR